MPAGFIKANESLPTVAKLDYGYLPQLKYYPRTAELNSGYDAGYNDIVIFRYAESHYSLTRKQKQNWVQSNRKT